MTIFFTADQHFEHTNIIKYCHRPFADVDAMNTALIENWNSVVRDGDIAYVVGDFCYHYPERYLSQLKGDKVLINGNHDGNRIGLGSLLCSFSGVKIYMQHRPPVFFNGTVAKADFVVCGHVHEKWRTMQSVLPLVNVGVDVWDFKPVSLYEIVKAVGVIKC